MNQKFNTIFIYLELGHLKKIIFIFTSKIISNFDEKFEYYERNFAKLSRKIMQYLCLYILLMHKKILI